MSEPGQPIAVPRGEILDSAAPDGSSSSTVTDHQSPPASHARPRRQTEAETSADVSRRDDEAAGRSTSRYKGVSYGEPCACVAPSHGLPYAGCGVLRPVAESAKGKWKVRICRSGRYTHIGWVRQPQREPPCFTTWHHSSRSYIQDEREAARLWDRVAVQLHGLAFLPQLNFPGEARTALGLPADYDHETMSGSAASLAAERLLAAQAAGGGPSGGGDGVQTGAGVAAPRSLHAEPVAAAASADATVASSSGGAPGGLLGVLAASAAASAARPPPDTAESLAAQYFSRMASLDVTLASSSERGLGEGRMRAVP